ncbi:MAG: hypothetical protein ACOYO1_06025 [Bacteroidales bacterium]
MKKIYFSLIIAILALNVFSQSLPTGKSELVQDEKIDELLIKHIKVNEIANTISGFRINIFFQSGNNSKTGAMQCKTLFNTKYPDIEAYVVYEEPNFKVKIGDFRTRMEARGFVQQIKTDFPDAFVIIDQINFPKILE